MPANGAAVPVALAVLAVWHAKNRREAPGSKVRKTRPARVPDERAEHELLGALLRRGSLTPAVAAANINLGISQAAEVLDKLAGKGDTGVTVVEGTPVYNLPDGGLWKAGAGVPGVDPLEPRGGLPEKTLPAGSPAEPLSEREAGVARLLTSGRTNREIAQELYVAPGTVKARVANTYRKLNARNRAEAVGRARDLSLLE